MNKILILAEKVMPLAAWRYGIVGVSSTAVDFIIFLFLLHWFGVPPLKANEVSFCVAVINSYVWNKRFAFDEHNHFSFMQFFKFLLVACGGLAISSGFIYLTAGILLPEIAKLLAIFLTFIWGFLASRAFVFNHRP